MTGGEVAIVLAAILAGAFVKSITGVGLPLIAIPVMSLFVSIEDAVAVISFPNLVVNGILLRGVRTSGHETRDLPILAVAGVVGAVAGTILLVTAPEDPLVVALAVIVLLYVIDQIWRPAPALAPAASHRWSPIVGFGAGVAQGGVGISGPIFVAWIHSYRLARDAFIFSVTALFLVSGSAQFAVLVIDRQIVGTRLVATLLSLVPVLAMIPLGTRLRERLAGPTFDRLILVMLAVSAAALLFRTFA